MQVAATVGMSAGTPSFPQCPGKEQAMLLEQSDVYKGKGINYHCSISCLLYASVCLGLGNWDVSPGLHSPHISNAFICSHL